MTVLTLNGARVLLCGATGGLGRALSAELARRGARLTAAGRDERILADLGPGIQRLAGDLRDPERCEAAVDAARAGADLDVVINAVGVAAFGPITEMSVQNCIDVLETNSLVPILIGRAALPQMSAGGVIANVSGVIAEGPQMPLNMAVYAASKAAASTFQRALAREARRQKVRVIDIRPPHTETGLAERAIAGDAPKLPAGLDPAHVARVICDALEGDVVDLPSTAFAVPDARHPAESNGAQDEQR